MRIIAHLLLAFVALCILIGCEPEKLVLWSPSGKLAAVTGEDGIYLCDAEGKLSKLLIPKAKPGAWIDDTHLIVKESISTQTWTDAGKLLTPAQRSAVESIAPKLVAKALAFEGPQEKLGDAMIAEAGEHANLLEGMLLYIREHDAAKLAARFGPAWGDLQNAEVSIHVLRAYELNVDRASPGATIFATFAPIYDVRLSANRSTVAFTTGERTSGGGRMSSLFVAPADASRPAILVSDMAGRHMDFSADGHLVYFRANLPRGESGDALRLGSLRRIKIASETGSLYPEIPIDAEKRVQTPEGEQSQPSAAEDIALVIYSEFNNVRCLRDGRIIFSNAEHHIPATNVQMPDRSMLFVVKPSDEQSTIEPLVDRLTQAKLAEIVEAFEISPDEKRIAIAGSGNHLTVLELGTGSITIVSPKDGDAGVQLPTWRNNDQLCYALVNAKDDERSGDLLLWSASQKASTWLSNGWANAVVKPLRKDD